MKSPWKSFEDLELDREYLVLASSIPAKSVSSTWKMFRGSRDVRRQLARTNGVIGFSLLARPVSKTYATLSVWTGQDALDRFATESPHREIMADLAPAMGPTEFVKWTITGAGGRPTWSDALGRLGIR